MAIEQFSRSLPMVLYRTLDAVMPRFRKIFNEFGLTEQQWRVLRVLWERQAETLNNLAGLTLIPAPSLVGIIDRLERKQLVNRQRSQSDRRKINIVLTTQGAMLEDEVMPRVAAEYADLSAWLSFSCRDGQHLNDGTHIRDAANAVLDIYPNLLATGVNCTAPRHIESLLDALASDLDVVLLAYPNSGEGWNAATRTWEGENDPYSFADYADRWVAAGARLIGGCCRTGVEHIERLRAARTR